MDENCYNEVDILYTLMSYVNVSSSQDMYYAIAHTILTHLDKIPDISISDLADLCYTSPATISRFCKDLNCRNFANFKHEISVALKRSENEIHLDSQECNYLKIHPQAIADKIYNEIIESLNKVHQSIDIYEVDKICQMIHQAKKIHMIGYQFNKVISNDFQMKMLKLGKFIYAFVERGDEIQRLDMITHDSLVIIVTARSRKQFIDPLVAKINKHHPTILLLTMNKDYKNQDIDKIVCIDGTQSDYTESSIQETMNFLSLLDLIYVRYGILYRK